MRLLLTRPRQEGEMLAQRLSDLGHETLVEPLLLIETIRQAKIKTENYQALLVTSVNGARAFRAHVEADRFRQVPIYAVGAATADVLGRFNVVHAGCGDVAALKKILCRELEPGAGPLLYVRGVHVAGDLAQGLTQSGYKVDQVVLYEAVEKEIFSQTVIQEFRNNLIEGVVLLSPRTAAVFSKLVEKADLSKNLDEVTFYCLSQNVSDSIQIDKKQVIDQVVIAGRPTQESLISAIRPD